MGKPGFPTCGEPVEPHPYLWGGQPLPTAVGIWGTRGSPSPCRAGKVWSVASGRHSAKNLTPITVDDAALLEAVSGVVLPSVAIQNPKSKI